MLWQPQLASRQASPVPLCASSRRLQRKGCLMTMWPGSDSRALFSGLRLPPLPRKLLPFQSPLACGPAIPATGPEPSPTLPWHAACSLHAGAGLPDSSLRYREVEQWPELVVEGLQERRKNLRSLKKSPKVPACCYCHAGHPLLPV